MRFWDTSALVPLLVAESETRRAQAWLREDPAVVMWTLTRVDLISALARRRRDEPRSAEVISAARRELLRAWEGFHARQLAAAEIEGFRVPGVGE